MPQRSFKRALFGPFLTHFKEVGSLRAAIARCHTTKHKDYGGRGIAVCPEWRENAWAFLRDMGPKPSEKHSLDRIDVNGDYSPSNCRWATNTEQARNKRNSVRVEANGTEMSIQDAMALTGKSYSALYSQVRTNISIEHGLAVAFKKKMEEQGLTLKAGLAILAELIANGDQPTNISH